MPHQMTLLHDPSAAFPCFTLIGHFSSDEERHTMRDFYFYDSEMTICRFRHMVTPVRNMSKTTYGGFEVRGHPPRLVWSDHAYGNFWKKCCKTTCLCLVAASAIQLHYGVMPLISLQDVSKLYGFGDATTLALDEVNLSIEDGEFVAVMGPSGCGKSTLMNVIGLLDRPTHGKYMLSSRSVARLTQGRRAKIRRDSIGFIFQSYNLLPRLTALENVALPLAYKGVLPGKRTKLAADMLERVGMGKRSYFYPPQLSGGQVQSVAIARALVNNPGLIIADEPTGNLDSASSRLVMELLSEIHKSGNTIIFVTHNPELTRYASRVVYMRDGAIIQDEQTKVGEIAKTALAQMYAVPEKTAEDDLAGISELMRALPENNGRPTKKAPAKKKESAAKKAATKKPAKAKTPKTKIAKKKPAVSKKGAKK